MTTRDRCIVAVHAHPDDESSKGAASIAKYADEGVRTVLVCCTDGGAGRRPVDLGEHDLLAARRAAELDRATALLGYTTTYRLGYADSGMTADQPDCFASQPLERVVAELTAIFEHERPTVIVTYDRDYARRHPDHQRAYDATRLAYERSSTPRKLYGLRTHTHSKLAAMHRWLNEHNQPSPFASTTAEPTDATTTRIDVHDYLPLAAAALRSHASQVDHDDPWFFSVPIDVMQELHPWDDYQLLDTRQTSPTRARRYETDLFDGI